MTAKPTLYQCGSCQRSFARIDHLARHVRTHTSEKPFECKICLRAFTRADLLKRHESKRHGEPSNLDSSRGNTGTRVSHACALCASSKLKCDNERPCQRCRRKGVSCEDASSISSDAQCELDASNVGACNSPRLPHHCLDQERHYQDQQDQDERMEAVAQNEQPSNHAEHEHATRHGQYDSHEQNDQYDQYVAPMAPVQPTSIPPVIQNIPTSNSFAGHLSNLLFTSPNAAQDFVYPAAGTSANTPFVLWNDYLSMDSVQDIFEIPFSSVDLPDLGSSTTLGSAPSPRNSAWQGESPEIAVSVEGAKAFRTSVWHWIPTSSDTGAASEPDPSLVPTKIPNGLDGDGPSLYSPDVLVHHLGLQDRDRVLSVILDRCDKSNMVRIATNFPKCTVLDQFLHTALHYQTIGSPISWLHVPTFSIETANDGLLCALVACGAFLSPVMEAQALGSALPELILAATTAQWAQNNALTRDLQIWQTCALVQHVLFWSGSKRRMEIAESTAQPLITILRRCGIMNTAQHYGADPTFDDSAAELDNKWRTWVEHESRIRLVHHVFVHDAQVSMTQFVNPLMHCSEMNVLLPSSDMLWSATTSEAWRACWHDPASGAREPKLHRSLSENVRRAFLEPHCKQAAFEQTQQFTPISAAFMVCGLWETVWSYNVNASWLRRDSLRFHTPPLGLSSRQEQASRVLEGIGPRDFFPTTRNMADCDILALNGANKLPPGTALLLHYLGLSLYAPLKDFPTFAGKEGAVEARRSYPFLQEWAQTPGARRSLWHAAQIYSNTRLMPPSQIQNFIVVALYQASLTLWTFSIVAGVQRLNELHSTASPNALLNEPSRHLFRLDSDMSLDVENFVALGVGSPAILVMRERRAVPVPVLYNPGAMMDAAVHICAYSIDQHPTHDLAHFVRVTTRLMDDLSKAALGVGFG